MKILKKHGVSLFFFLLLFGIGTYGIYNTAISTSANQKKSLEEALYRGIIECYALEGSYPESISYLLEEYAIVYDASQFDIDYEIIGSNIMPTVLVLDK